MKQQPVAIQYSGLHLETKNVGIDRVLAVDLVEQEKAVSFFKGAVLQKHIENTAYHRRLLMYKGMVQPEELLNEEEAGELDLATMGYGVANWHLYHGRTDRAKALLQRVVAGNYWPAFGFIAAEADLAQLRN